MGINASEVVTVVDASQVSAARFAAHAMATAAGFGRDDVHRVGIVATELASNLVKHTREGGVLLFHADDEEAGAGVDITALDRGPGITNFSLASVDGFSTAGSLGGGLGAVRRMTDECDMYSAPGKGLAIAVRVRRGRPIPHGRLVLAGIAVPAPGEQVCGDHWNVWTDANGMRIAMADGLGHGPEAARASRLAIEVMAGAPTRPGVEAMQAAHHALRPTRGAAAAIAHIDVGASLVRFVGIGNIGCVLDDSESVRHAVSLGGTLGHETRQFREFTYPWRGDVVAVMYSDGLTSHWSLNDYPGLRTCSPAVIAGVLYRDFTRGRDDVTVVVVKEAR